MRVLSLNPGSSTLKFGVFDLSVDEPVARGMIDRLDGEGAVLTATIKEPLGSKLQRAAEPNKEPDGSKSLNSGKSIKEPLGSKSLKDAVRLIVERFGAVDAIGCRVVHGGEEFTGPTLVTEEVLAGIRRLAPLAPLHNLQDLGVLETARAATGKLPVVAVFDTSFHRTLPAVASSYALPATITESLQVRRYGFHGISYKFIADQMARRNGSAKGRLIACHLGNGSSVCAILDGRSIETSMGMTPLEGLIMGTRSGDLDPGALLYIMRQTGMTPEDADRVLNHESGLLALSRRSPDVREIEQFASQGDEQAEFALEAYAYRVAKYIGAYWVALGGLDQLVFAGGIGENSGDMRRRICGKLTSLGISGPLIEPGPETVSQVSSDRRPSVFVVRTDEDRQIATETMGALA